MYTHTILSAWLPNFVCKNQDIKIFIVKIFMFKHQPVRVDADIKIFGYVQIFSNSVTDKLFSLDYLAIRRIGM